VNWSVDQVQQLQYSHLVHKVTEQQGEWSGLYDKFVAEGLVNKAAAPSKQVCRVYFQPPPPPGGGGLLLAGYTQRKQANLTAGGPRQSLTSEIRPTPLYAEAA
jgi:hypothetical protein